MNGRKLDTMLAPELPDNSHPFFSRTFPCLFKSQRFYQRLSIEVDAFSEEPVIDRIQTRRKIHIDDTIGMRNWLFLQKEFRRHFYNVGMAADTTLLKGFP